MIYRSIIKVKIIPFREKVAGKHIPVIAFIVLFLSIQFSPFLASGQSDTTLQNSVLNTKVSLSLKNVSIQKVLDTLSTYPNVRFSYVNYDLPLQEQINIEAKEQSLERLLNDIFGPYKIKYYVVSKQIVLKKEKKSLTIKDKFSPSADPGKFSISLFGSVGSSYRRLKSNNLALVDDRNKDEKAIGNFSAGGYLTYQWLPSVALRSGINLFNIGEKGTFSYAVTDSLVPGNNGNGNGSGNGTGNGNNIDTVGSNVYGKYKNKYNYLTIPLMIGYTLGKQKIYASAYTGIGMGFFLSYSTTFPTGINDYQNSTAEQKISSVYQKDARVHSYRKIVLTLPVMVEIGYRLNKELGFFGAIGLNYFTSSIYTSDENVKHKPYYFNAAIGLTYYMSKTGK